ncbi:hypothetical protein ACQP08_20640 [Micromonospora zamorensis]|uniref:hypothetical protein n=1 Tax=Micromonospora zamorensis TaxID=709883 RepID=UPI003D8ED703
MTPWSLPVDDLTCTEPDVVRPLKNTIEPMIEYRLISLTDAPPERWADDLQAVPILGW